LPIQNRGWGEAERIEDVLTEDSEESIHTPRVAFDHDGNAFAVFVLPAGPSGQFVVYVNYYDATDGEWRGEEIIEANSDLNSEQPQIAFDDEGNAIAVWRQFDLMTQNIMSNRYSRLTGWDDLATPHPLEDEAGEAHDPQFAFDSEGNGLAIWHQ